MLGLINLMSPQNSAKLFSIGVPVNIIFIDTLMELLKPLYLNGHKVVVFSRFTKMLALIEKSIILEHMNYYYLDGSTQNRMGVVDAFEKSDNGIFLISLKAGGTGLNLISADTAVIYDPY